MKELNVMFGYLLLFCVLVTAEDYDADYFMKNLGGYGGYGTRSYNPGTKTGYTKTKTFTKTGYGHRLPHQMGYAGTKTSRPLMFPEEVETFDPLLMAGPTTVQSKYKGGCNMEPLPPMNGNLKCSSVTGCRGACNPNYQFPNGDTQLFAKCINGEWRIEMDTTLRTSFPTCEPVCLPACENNGICVAPNQCNCPDDFSGPQCQFESKPCLNYPPLPKNSRRTCRSSSCTVTCARGHQFPDGSTIQQLSCKNGNWVPSQDKFVTLPDCDPICDPPCENEGRCMSFNVCLCPKSFRGAQCQYSVDQCKPRRLNFNGGYNCTGGVDEFTCSLQCAEGGRFEFPPAPVYTCNYATGVFLPSPIPQCLYEPNVHVVGLNESGSSYFSTSISYSASGMPGMPGIPIDLPTANPDFHFEENFGGIVSIQQKTPEPGSCITWRGSHFKTFDGKVYSFESKCAYTMVKDANDNTFNIIVQNHPSCADDFSSCHKIITIFYQGKEYILTWSQGIPVLMNNKKALPIPSQVPGLRVEMIAHYIVLWLDTVGVKIRWDGKLFVQTEVKENLWNRTTGLCGRLDGYESNDIMTRDGIIPRNILTMVNSWQTDHLGDECNSVPKEEHACVSTSNEKAKQAKMFCEQVLADKRFSACHKTMDVAVLMDACQWDYCSCMEVDPKSCACDTLNVYVRECTHKGIKSLASWRDENICPMVCTGGRIYMPSAPPGGQDTCGTSIDNGGDVDNSEEGCYCPKGLVLHENKCITKDKCTCRLRGKDFKPGATVPKNCNTCTCSNGQWVCTEVSCGARCSALGDPHYITFDGKRYDFMGQCSYYLVKTDNFTIEAENVACSGAISLAMNLPISIATGLPSCTKTVTIRYDGQEIHLKQNQEITINGKELNRSPFVVGGVRIRTVSSLFTVVELLNGVRVWWDGLTRVYIDVPPSFKGQTSGLCGTFTENQKDDFLTPENDVEHSIIQFANKWKTSEKCNDVPEKLKEHPCDVNIQNRIIAEAHCKKIKSDLFGSCHIFVDPESFYQDCLYDMCSCEVKLSNCLCPMIAAYAQECALQGVKVDWRSEIKECGVSCTGGQVYQVCGNSCTRTCYDIATTPNCKDLCVEGCNCPEGLSLDDYGECVPIAQCHCELEGLSFPPGYKEVRPASKGQELCTCKSAAWDCRLATPQEIKKYPKASDKKNMCDESKHFEFTTCEPPEPTTCKNMHRNDLYSASVCHAGCKCKDGYVLDTSTKTCVKPINCPCHHGGKSYGEKAVVQNDCNTCTCKKGKWECTDRQCSAECSAWGDSHFKTFDGKMYDYQGQCDYVLAKGKLNSVDNFQISIQNVPCGSTGVSCSKSLTIRIGPPDEQEKVTLVRHNPVQSPQILKTFTVRTLDLFVIVEAADLGLVVHWDKGTRVYVKVDPRWKNKVSGLCGNYNDNEMDDFQTPFGGVPEASAKLFGDSWKMQSYCPDAEEITDTCEKRPDRRTWALKKCGILKTPTFAACHSEVPVDLYYDKCVFDSCACDEGGDCECLCTALAAYAQECNSKGVPIKWRSQELCPIQCDERCAQYSPCVSSCPLETCDNLLIQNPLTKLCKEDSCVEGCIPKPCPPDHVYANSSYNECVPKNICKPICLELDNITYYEGDKMEEDDCHTCFCSRGTKTCKGEPCTTITPEPTTTTTTGQLDSKPSCKSGWTTWINQDKLIPTKTSTNLKDEDIEPIPTNIIMNQLKDGSHCEPNQITNIECRTVGDHQHYKKTGLDVECSLEDGLICKSGPTKCVDFEIRVFCSCEEPTTPPTLLLPNQECDEKDRLSEHPTNCHLYYKCSEGANGLEEIEKSCGDNLMFHPVNLICDNPENVYKVKPHCKPKEEINQCDEGFEWRDCALRCDKVCNYHKYTVKERGECLDDNLCVSKCTPIENPICEGGYYWNGDNSCRKISDCTCRANDGSIVKPGQVHHEGNCTKCQCIDNIYTCTTSCNDEHEIVEVPPLEITEETGTVIISTVTPPKECLPDMFMNLIQGDQPLPDESILASSYYDDGYLPKYSKMNSGKSWKPKENDKEPYLQIDLGRQEPVYGVILKGNVKDDEYVLTYKVAYIPDTHDKYQFVHGKNRKIKVFPGSVDAITPSKQLFDVPFEATKVRIYPKTWHDAPSLRVELIGCSDIITTTSVPSISTTTKQPYLCDDEMGLQNGLMSLEQVSVSSQLSGTHSKAQLKLDSKGAWQPFTNTPTEFIIFDFLEPRNITGIKTKGGPKGYVTQYKIKYSSDGNKWHPLVDDSFNDVIFNGNFDHSHEVSNMFDMPIQMKYLKLEPVRWESNIQLKVEPLGCFLPYPEVIVTVPTVESSTSCNYCPGIPQNEDKCNCDTIKYWDGEKCIDRAECPCVVNHMTYKIGQSYLKEDCKECFCKLGGVEHCVEKQCEKCKNGMQSKISNTCECMCTPCPEDEILCPTSNICINKAKWCDGVMDCPDDELNCTKPTEPTTTEKPRKECPVPVCSPGYQLQEKAVSKGSKYLNFLATMFNRKPSKQSSKSYSFAKTKSRKHQPHFKKPTHVENVVEIEEEKCKEYVCVPVIETPVCPPASCPPGYTPVYNPMGFDKGFCAGYKCHLPDAICNITGRTFNTFDNTEFKYDICNHVIARDLIGTNWDIALKKKCDDTRCNLKVLINHHLDSFVIYSDLKTIKYNGYKYNIDQMEKISKQSPEFNVDRLGEMILFSSSKYGFWVTIDKVSNVKVGVSSELKTQVDGLCGYFNGNSDDDKRKPDGTLAKTSLEFGDSWSYGDQADCEIRKCPEEIEKKAIDICNRVKDQTLSPCASAINIDAFISRCLETTCSCLQASKGNLTGEDDCRCSTLQSFVIDCMQSDTNVEVGNWRAQHNCPISCTPPLVPHDCYRRPCELTCETVSDPNACPKLDTVCFPGCYCPPGLVRQGDTCIQPPSCRDCECNVLPHLQYVTYDESNFTVNGNCVYVMSRDVLESLNEEHKFQVLVTNHPCEHKPNKMCLGKITILFAGHKIHILRDEIRNRLKMIVDSERIYDYSEVSDWMEVQETKSKHIKVLLKAVQVHVSVYYPSLGVSVKAPSQQYGGKMEGLCGDCNRDKSNDMKLPNGQFTTDEEDFGASWLYDKIPGQTKETCAPEKEEPCQPIPADSDPCDQLLDSHKFGLCHPLLDPAMFVEWCKKDICNGDLGQACTAIEAYAKECMSSNICINWRTNLCPAKSCPAGQEYEPCGTSCPKTCESIQDVKSDCHEMPVEGCFCPEGKVMKNNTCVEERECTVCDDEGHHPGDTWQKDACTSCSCVGTNVNCETKHCPKVETLCEDGYSVVKVPSDKNECCDKYICVPVETTPTCEPPQQLQCNEDQEMKLVKKSDGCQKFVCECKPIEECTPIDQLMNKTIEEGYEKVINNAGCCPKVNYICKKELCSEPQQCPTFYNLNKMEIPEKCCPIYTCEPPKKCIIDLIYTSSELGGEKLRNENDKQKLVKEVGEKWQDGPCRECECSGSPEQGYHSNCLQKNCPQIQDSEDNNEYVLDYEPIPNECCSLIKRIGCKYDDKEYKIGEKWPAKDDYCSFMECINSTNGILRTTERMSCDNKCELGYEYILPNPEDKLCCGSCKPYACVVEGNIKKPGEKWQDGPCKECECFGSSEQGYHSNCIQKNCPQIEDSEDNNEYILEYEQIPNECCPLIKRVGCKYDNKEYKIGEKWPAKDDYCSFMECINTTNGILRTTERMSCDNKCELGYEYIPPNPEDKLCCGSCKPYACVVDGNIKAVGEKWLSNDYCTEFVCVNDNGTLRIDGKVETCIDIPKEQLNEYVFESNTVDFECCKKHKPVACKVGEMVYQVGETWPSPDLDKCKKVSCVKTPSGDILKQESIETCNKNCSKGWEYKESSTSCCGECKSVFCVIEDQLRRPNETWKSEDGCITYTCEKQADQMAIVSQQEFCPSVDDCPTDNIYTDGCCKRCNLTSVSQINCAPAEIPSEKTIGLFQMTKHSGVICKNFEAIGGLMECQGSCESSTAFNLHSLSFESQCSCCRATDYSPAIVELQCDDGTNVRKEIDVPSSCSCEGCVAQNLGKLLNPTKTFTKTKGRTIY